MVKYSPKWGLATEELGDTADMPRASSESVRTVEAALDSVVAQFKAADTNKVSKSGDSISGDLVVSGRVSAGYDFKFGQFSWIYEVGQAKMIRWSPNGTAVESVPCWIDYSTGVWHQPAVTSFEGSVAMPGVIASPGGADLTDPGSRALVRMSDGTVKALTRTGFNFWMAASTQMSSAAAPPEDELTVLRAEIAELRSRIEALEAGA